MPAHTPEQLFGDALRADPARPLVTYYDEATGERSELSAKSMANWVAKTYHLISGELGLGVGDSALIALPAHWISVPALLGALCAGLELRDDGPADVAFVTGPLLGAADAFAVNPAAAAVGYRDAPPSGTADYVLAVRPQPDAWTGVAFPAGPDGPCWAGMSRAEVVAAARARAADLGLAGGARTLTTRGWDGPAAWLDTLIAPLAVGGSVVYVANSTDESVIERRIAQERVTGRI